MKNLVMAALAIAVAGAGAYAYAASERLPLIYKKGNAYYVVTPKGRVAVTPVTDDIFCVTTLPKGENLRFFPSQSAILAPQAANINTAASVADFLIFSPTTTVKVDRKTGNVTFLDAEGNVILAEKTGIDNASGTKSVTFEGSDDEIFYGAGERGHKFNLRGDTLTMYNRQNYGYTGDDPRISQMNITMPLFLASEGFAIVFDDYAAATMALTDPIVYTTESRKPVTYYYIGGCDNLADLTEQLTELTGRQPMPPLWSLGYITSKYGYRTQAETTGVIDTLRTQGYPVDGIVLDLYWYGKEEDMGRLAWDPEQWPDHKGMLRSLDSLGVKVVAISQPYVLRNGRAIDNYNTLAPKGCLLYTSDAADD